MRRALSSAHELPREQWLSARPFRTVRGVLGGQASEDLVTWIASGHDELRAGICADMQELINGRSDALEQRLSNRIDALEEKLSNRIDAVDERLSNRMDALDEKLSQRIHQVDVCVVESKVDLMRWSFVFWVGAVAAVAALAGVLRGP